MNCYFISCGDVTKISQIEFVNFMEDVANEAVRVWNERERHSSKLTLTDTFKFGKFSHQLSDVALAIAESPEEALEYARAADDRLNRRDFKAGQMQRSLCGEALFKVIWLNCWPDSWNKYIDFVKKQLTRERKMLVTFY